jgi:hypothetical protein
VVPLLTIDHTALLGISTPGVGLRHFFTRLMNLEDASGKPLFLVHRIEMICSKCKLLKPSLAALCSHMAHRLPPWKTVTTQGRVDLIMASDPVTHARENMGIVIDSNTYVFSKALVEAFACRQRVTFDATVNQVHIAIDPSGGGAASDYAIVSLVYHLGKHVVSYNRAYQLRTPSTTSNTVLNLMWAGLVVVLPHESRPIVKPSNTAVR